MKIKKAQEGTTFETLDLLADKWEPAAAGLSLASIPVGMGMGSSIVLSPFAAPVALAMNVPSTTIDGYLAARDWYKHFTKGGNLGSALWNTVETGLDILGGKAAVVGGRLLSTAKTAKVAPKVPVKPQLLRSTRGTYSKRVALYNKDMATYVSTLVELNKQSILLAKQMAKEKYGKDLWSLPIAMQQSLRDLALREILYRASNAANLARWLEYEKSALKWNKLLTPLLLVPTTIDITKPIFTK